MKSIQLFNVSPSMPQELSFLETLSRNPWWCWNGDAFELFRRIEPTLWRNSGHNPLRFFSQIPQGRLEALVEDEGFMSHCEQVQQRFEAEVHLGEDGKPFEEPKECVAYFSCEYGIHESLRLYSGGLGCLAGDHLKAASDMGLPLVAVGLMYRCGYFQQFLSEDGWQQEACPENQVHFMPMQRAVDDENREVEVFLPLPDGVVKAAVWRLPVGRIPLFLLDTNIPDNPPGLREITWQLYQSDRKTRLRQELLLGIGGMRALEALGFSPLACHINEGHAAFLSLERVAQVERKLKVGVEESMEIVRRTNIFTTHTPVPAGNETFSPDLVRSHLAALKNELPVSPETIMTLGRPPGTDDQHDFSMTVLGIRTAKLCNGVSKLHGQVARRMWAHLWPGRPHDEVPIRHVTNGAHVSSWLSSDNASLYDRHLGPEWRDDPSTEPVLARVMNIPDEELWRAHEINRTRLVRAAREQGEKQYAVRNAPKAEVDIIRKVLRHDVLTIGFARRFATYKRATLLFRDRARLEALLTNKERPVQIILAGKAHPADDTAKELIREVVRFSRQEHVRSRIIFLEDYDIRIGRYMVQGVDVWLNTPRRPQEASGTSGMKAAVNGGINLSCLDGWWDEAYTPECGWAIGAGEEYENADYQDAVESKALYNLLENEVIPCFYDRSDAEIPEKWIGMMKSSIRTAFSFFSSCRMLKEYNANYYEPAMQAYRELSGNDCALARELVARRQRLETLWGQIAVERPTTDRDISNVHVGETFRVSVTVQLGEIQPEEVDIQVYYGPVSTGNAIVESHSETMTLAEQKGEGVWLYSHELTCRHTGRYGLTARAMPRSGEWRQWVPGFLTWADGV